MVERSSVLFVCLGNICRSPLAECIFRALIRDAGVAERFTVDSAGTGDYHIGDPPHPQTQKHARESLGLDLSGCRARQVTADDLLRFDYVVAMDSENLANLRRLPSAERCPRLALLSSFARASVPRDVPDPYFGGPEGFGTTQKIVEHGCRGLLQSILEAG